jgi:hypothetical protein
VRNGKLKIVLNGKEKAHRWPLAAAKRQLAIVSSKQ